MIVLFYTSRPDISTDERFEIETKKEPMSDTDERMSSPFEDVDNRVNQWVQEVQENCRQNLGIQPLMAHPIQLNPDSIVNSAKGNVLCKINLKVKKYVKLN